MYFSDKFICASNDYCTYDVPISAPYFRYNFNVSEAHDKIELTVCGLGFYELYVNGVNITKGKFAPYISNPNDVLYYDNYNILPYIAEGKNVVGLLLGNGMLNAIGGETWGFDKAEYRSAPKLALAVEADGKLLFEANASFLTHPSPIVFDDLRAGERYDATKKIVDWNKPYFDDTNWQKAICATTPKGEARLVKCEPITVSCEIPPKNITKIKNGYLYDFGVNTAGVCRICVTNAKKHQKISLLHGEMLINGELNIDNIICDEKVRRDYYHIDEYVCNGEKMEYYEPHFTYHGFRYVYVEGIFAEQANDKLLTLIEMHSNLSQAGSFSCSDNILNRVQENTCRSTLSNFFYFLTDCPHREKNGWTGDTAVSAEQVLLNFHAENSLEEWLVNVRKAQRQDGQLPGIVPTAGWGFDWGNGVAWDAALTYVAYYIYKYTASERVLEDNAASIALYLRFLQKKRKDNGLLEFGLGDWCQPGKLSHLYETPLEVTDSLISINICDMAEKIFLVLKKYDDAKLAKDMRDEIRFDFRKKYIKNGQSSVCTQTALALALAYKIFEPSEQARAFRQLYDVINEDGCFSTGILGAKELFGVLSDFGNTSLAYKLITQDKFPSFYYHIKRGATTLFEDFQEFKEGTFQRKDGKNTNSLNHHFFGSVSAWFYKYLVGLNINPDFFSPNKVVFQPKIIQELQFVEGKYNHNKGVISLRWSKKQDNISVEIFCPKGIEGVFVCPFGYSANTVVNLTDGKNIIELQKL